MADWKDHSYKIDIENGYAIAMFVDRFEIFEYPFKDSGAEKRLAKDFDTKLVDIRIFDAEKEYRIFRGDVSCREFFFRKLDDSCSEIKYDDEQFVDIDAARTTEDCINNCEVRSVSGGYYKIPVKSILRGQNADLDSIKIHIRNYVAFDEYGQGYIKDWRITNIK